MTVRELYQWAAERRILDASIRICDGMAVSYYPEASCLQQGRYETIIDVSTITPVDYDELDGWADIVLRDADWARGRAYPACSHDEPAKR